MRNNHTIKLTIFLLSLNFLSCSNDRSASRALSVNTSSILVKEKTFNFGNILEHDSLEHRFKIINNGKIPLIIKGASASCGCTVPNWEKKPISPKGVSEIVVKFKPTGKGFVNKSIVVQANTMEVFHVFYIKGNVI